ncbi:MAG: hypothetical protein IKO41_00260 [Lachnospiraceae bacterium]|nr:hypothetical protein [Lachnospiraceae bacterium]
MTSVHFFMQGKGGVGKSVCCSQFSQFLRDNGNDLICYDCDPVNHTLNQYQDLTVTPLDLFYNDSDTFDPRKFDEIIYVLEDIANKENAQKEENPDDFAGNAHVVIDTGASAFIPLLDYMNSGAIDAIKECGHNIYIHNIIAGGDNLDDCVLGLDSLINKTSDAAKIIVWKNYYFGDVATETNLDVYIANHKRLDPKSPTYKEFEDFNVYKENKSRYFGLITMKKFHSRIEYSVKEMLKFRLTFRTILTDKDCPYKFNILERHNIKIARDAIYNQLDQYNFDE